MALVRASTGDAEGFAAALAAAPGLEPEALVAFARAQQLLPWLGFCTADLARDPVGSALLPASALDAFREAREENLARAGRLAVRSREIGEAFAAESMELLFLKGLTHGAFLYRDPAMRFQADVDLLVRRGEVRRAVELLSKLGYDTSVDAATGEPLEARVAQMLGEAGGKLRNSCTLGRGPKEKVDLHWCIRTDYERALPAARLWSGARRVEIGGARVQALSQEHLLAVLLLNIAADLRKSRLRAKLWLDLYLACQRAAPDDSWAGFLERRAADGSHRLVVNVLSLFLFLWRCGDEFPELHDAVRHRAHLIETLAREEALEIVTRPRDDRRNHRWHDRIRPDAAARRLLTKLREPARSLARLRDPRRGVVLLDAPS